MNDLEIKITSDASKALSSLDKIISAMERLSTAAQGTNLDGVTGALSRFATAMNNVTGDGKSAENISKMANAMKELASGMKSIGSAGKSAGNAVGSVLKQRQEMEKLSKQQKMDKFISDRDRQMAYDLEAARLATLRNQMQDLNSGTKMSSAEYDTFIRQKYGLGEKQERINYSAETESAKTYAKSMEELGKRFSEVKLRADELENELNIARDGQADQATINSLKQEAKAYNDAATYLNNAVKRAKVTQVINPDAIGDANALIDQLSYVPQAVEPIRTAFDRLSDGVGVFFKSSMKMFDRFVSMGISRIFRQAIMSMMQGLGEGMTNVYNYSKNIGGWYSSAIDGLAISMDAFKNSIGAAAASLYGSLASVLSAVLNIATSVVNVLNQIVSILMGRSTWTEYVAGASAASAATKGAGKAAKDAKDEIKGLLASWDELNIIQNKNDDSNSGGGGGGGGGGGSMLGNFKESEFTGIMGTLAEHIDLVRAAAAGLGSIFLAWKIAPSLFKDLTTLQQTLGFGLGIAGLVYSIEQGFDQIGNGVNMQNVAKHLGGLAVGMLGMQIAFGKGGSGVALVADGMTRLGLSLKDMYDNGITGTNAHVFVTGLIETAAGIAIAIPLISTAAKAITGSTLYTTLGAWFLDLKDTATAMAAGGGIAGTLTSLAGALGAITAVFVGSGIVGGGMKKMGDFLQGIADKTQDMEFAAEAIRTLGIVLSAFGDALIKISEIPSNVFNALFGTAEVGDVNVAAMKNVADGMKRAFESDSNLKFFNDMTDEEYKVMIGGVLQGDAQAIMDFYNKYYDGTENAPALNLAMEIKSEADDIATKAIDLDGETTHSTHIIDVYANDHTNGATSGGGFFSGIKQLFGFAAGGFPIEGDLFYANEQTGRPEYIGSMGGRTAVANNDQIVSGIASGVASANSEQNSLLREQNQLLRQILAKKGEVVFPNTPEAGRAVSRAISSYNMVRGRA